MPSRIVYKFESEQAKKPVIYPFHFRRGFSHYFAELHETGKHSVYLSKEEVLNILRHIQETTKISIDIHGIVLNLTSSTDRNRYIQELKNCLRIT